MKHLFYSLLTLLLLCACDSDEGPTPPPEKPAPHLNVKDSLAVAEIWKQADGPNWFIKWDLTNMYTWGGTSVALDTTTNEYRIVELQINVPSLPSVYGTISPRIGDLKELRLLYIGGKNIQGIIPEEIAKLKYLHELWIGGTSISGEIPKGLFLLPELNWLDLSGNKLTGELPKEMAQLPASMLRCHISSNLLYGKIPEGIKARFDVSHNNITEIPFSYFKFSAEPLTINVLYNRLSGVIPDYILNDDQSLERLRYLTEPQQEGYVYSNLPTITN